MASSMMSLNKYTELAAEKAVRHTHMKMQSLVLISVSRIEYFESVRKVGCMHSLQLECGKRGFQHVTGKFGSRHSKTIPTHHSQRIAR